MTRLSVVEERAALTAISLVLFLLFGGSALRSPDGMEMLRLSASWLGSPTEVGDPNFWPPLWSLLNVPAVALGYDTAGARLLNLSLWGALAWPLHRLSTLLGGRHAGRIAVAVYVLMPTFLTHAPVLDARPLGAIITTAFLAASVAAVQQQKGSIAVVLLAAGVLAGLAAIPIARGARSLAWSRTGDVIEWLAIALALPAGLMAADAIDLLRGMMGA